MSPLGKKKQCSFVPRQEATSQACALLLLLLLLWLTPLWGDAGLVEDHGVSSTFNITVRPLGSLKAPV